MANFQFKRPSNTSFTTPKSPFTPKNGIKTLVKWFILSRNAKTFMFS